MIIDEQGAIDWIKALPECDALAFDRLTSLIDMLVEENGRQNLVARGSMGRVWQRHIVDSAQLLHHVPRGTTPTWLDLGTGAGFPGLVIAILRPDIAITMVESRRRRIDWLLRVCETLDLRLAQVAGSPLEKFETQNFDVISARAFAQLANLLDLSARFSTNTTLWLLPKGRSAAQELNELSGWSHTFHVEPSLTDPDAGIVVGNLTGRKGAKP